QLHHVTMLGRDERGSGRTLGVGVVPLLLEASSRPWRRLDGILQRLVVEPPPRLLMPVLVGCLANGGDERIGKPVIEARARRFPRYLAELARHDIVFPKYKLEDFKQCPPAGPELLRHHDDRNHRRPRFAGLISEPVPEPRSLRVVRNEPRKKGFEGLDLAPARRVRRRPVAVEDD